MTTPRATPHGFNRRLAIETPESVVIELELAGVGSRFGAAVYDLLLVFLLFVALALVFAFVARGSGLGAWVTAILILLIFVVLWGYFALFEGLMNGQTPGKKNMGLRVVMDTGHPVTFGAAVSRNLVRVVDAQPGLLYGVGILFVFFHRDNKRLGDIVAGTVVVRDRPQDERLSVVPETTDAPTVSEVPELTDEEFRVLDQFLTRRFELDAAVRSKLASSLVGRLMDRLPRGSRGVEGRLEALFALERGRRAGAMAGARGTRGTRGGAAGRFVSRRQASWEAFRGVALEAEKRGLRGFSGDALTTFAARYREATADLARARTYGVDPRVIAYLERAVSAGHNALYGLRGVRRTPLAGLALRDLPAAVWRARSYVLVAFLLTAVPAAGGYALLREQPERAAQLLPDEMIARAEAGVTESRAGLGYAQTPSPYLPIVASNIISNNIQVAFGAFAFGITAGIGTVLVLFFNGLSIGAVFGLFANYGLAGWLATFIAGHGVLELTAIFIAGAAGLMIGRAVLAPGDAPRRDALVIAGREAILLVAAAAFLLVLAGSIEGLLSASGAPPAFKFAVSGASAVLLGLLAVAGRRAAISAS